MNHRALTSSGFGWEVAWDPGDPGALRDAFRASGGLVVVKDQSDLSPEGFLDIARLFGQLELNEKYDPDFLLPGYPEILRLGNLKEGGRYRALFVKADPEPLLWHTDDSFRDPQPLGSCILAKVVPPEGAATGYAGMAAAYDALSDAMKQRIRHLVAVHSYEHLNEYLRTLNPHRPPLSEALKREHPPVERPLVSVHPETGRRCLYVPKCHIESIHGLTAGETDELLSELLAHVTQEAFAFMHQWSAGDVVVWDNRSVLHAPSPFDSDRYDRLLYRITMRKRVH